MTLLLIFHTPFRISISERYKKPAPIGITMAPSEESLVMQVNEALARRLQELANRNSLLEQEKRENAEATRAAIENLVKIEASFVEDPPAPPVRDIRIPEVFKIQRNLANLEKARAAKEEKKKREEELREQRLKNLAKARRVKAKNERRRA